MRLGFEPVFFEPIVEIGFCGFIPTGNETLGCAIGQESFDLWTVGIKFTFARSAWATELHTLRLAEP